MDIKDILEEMALPARSNKHGFKVTDKLEKIEEILSRENSDFTCIKKNDHAWIFGKKEPERVSDPENAKKPVLISTHADIVSEIKNPFSEYDEDKKYFKGTYDNLGTNASAVNLMLNKDMPDNVYFAFTAEEESGRFTGAEFSYSYIKNRAGVVPNVIVLDVTYEGYDDDRLFTIEGLSAPTEEKRVKFLEDMIGSEGSHQSFEVIRLKKKDDNSFLPKEYQSKELTDCDESYFYAKQNCLSFSLDLPTDGSMHSDRGLYVKEAVMRGYSEGLASAIYILTNTHEKELEDIKSYKDGHVLRAKDTPFMKNKVSSVYYPSSYNYPSYTYPSSRDDDYMAGQMTIYDYLDEESYENSYRNLNEDLYYEDDGFADWYDMFVDTAYEMVTNYGMDDFDTYERDLLYTIGLDSFPPELEEMVQNIWEEVWKEQEKDIDD